jgi:hypothetical protein
MVPLQARSTEASWPRDTLLLPWLGSPGVFCESLFIKWMNCYSQTIFIKSFFQTALLHAGCGEAMKFVTSNQWLPHSTIDLDTVHGHCSIAAHVEHAHESFPRLTHGLIARNPAVPVLFASSAILVSHTNQQAG